jgi:hypothetical protein
MARTTSSAGTFVSAFDRVYGIRNQGTQNLDLTDPVTISNVQGCTVQVTQPNWPVIPQGEELLTLTIAPSAAGNFSFQVNIETNDAARTPYTITVSGSAEESSGSSSDDSSGCALGTNRLPLLGFALLGAIVATRRRRWLAA